MTTAEYLATPESLLPQELAFGVWRVAETPTPRHRVRGAPDLVVEVLSPQPRVGDINERVQWFAEYDVRECWLVHQIERWIDVLTFENGKTAMRLRFAADERIESGVLPVFDRSLTEMLGYSPR